MVHMKRSSVKALSAFDDFGVRILQLAGKTSIEAVLCFYHTTSRQDLPLFDRT
ncbi:hypothetical protein BYT27DRAFT_7199886 [Phlegmacium glaucopus]|nr:hypothetical protein BYT27DRAFT_7199886 [Phlegmacium glaucopus]